MENPNTLSKPVTCCICIPIRAGVWTLSILNMLGAAWNIFNCGALLIVVAGVEEYEGRDAIFMALGRAEAGIKLGLGIINLILTILLMKGLHERQPEKLRIWVKVNLSIVALGTLAAVSILITALVVLGGSGDGPMVGGFIVLFMALALLWQGFCIWVVHRYVGVLGEEDGVPLSYLLVDEDKA